MKVLQCSHVCDCLLSTVHCKFNYNLLQSSCCFFLSELWVRCQMVCQKWLCSWWKTESYAAGCCTGDTQLGSVCYNSMKYAQNFLCKFVLFFCSKLGLGWILETLYLVFPSCYAFCYNSTESEPIWMKSGALWVHCVGLALADFRHDPRTSESGTARGNFVLFCQVNNAQLYRFPVHQISGNLHTRRGSVSRWILSEQNFKNLSVRCRFFKKCEFFPKIFYDLQHQTSITP